MTSMSTASTATPRPDAAPRLPQGEVGDYFALLKPRVMFLVVFTALVGMVVDAAGVHPVIGLRVAPHDRGRRRRVGRLNMWWDADIDALMTRTRKRPIPAGKHHAAARRWPSASTLAVGSVLVLGLVANWLAAGLLAFTIFFYVVVYSMWLKRSTPQNIVIGGAAGALPPMVAQAAVTGAVGLESSCCSPSSSCGRRRISGRWRSSSRTITRRAGIPMMPNVAGPDSTRRQILVYTLLLAPLGCCAGRSSASAASPTRRSRRSAASA